MLSRGDRVRSFRGAHEGTVLKRQVARRGDLRGLVVYTVEWDSGQVEETTLVVKAREN